VCGCTEARHIFDGIGPGNRAEAPTGTRGERPTFNVEGIETIARAAKHRPPGRGGTEGLPESIGDIEDSRVSGRKAITENNRIVECRVNTRVPSVVKGHD
jgi:hypothetical protein